MTRGQRFWPATSGGRPLEAAERAAGGENGFLPVRTRFVDDVLAAEVRPDDQVILVGAGLDTARSGCPSRPASTGSRSMTAPCSRPRFGRSMRSVPCAGARCTGSCPPTSPARGRALSLAPASAAVGGLPSMQPHLGSLHRRGSPPPFTTDDPAGLFVDRGWNAATLFDPAELARARGRPMVAPVEAVADPDVSMRTSLVVGARGLVGRG